VVRAKLVKKEKRRQKKIEGMKVEPADAEMTPVSEKKIKKAKIKTEVNAETAAEIKSEDDAVTPKSEKKKKKKRKMSGSVSLEDSVQQVDEDMPSAKKKKKKKDKVHDS